MGGEIIKENRSTGVRMVVSGGPQFVGPKSLAVFPPVLIDIKPGNDRNNINICAKGVLPVAILSSETFDATEVDPTTVDLEGAGVKLDKKDNPVVKSQEGNDDGWSDMVAKCEIPELVDLTSE